MGPKEKKEKAMLRQQAIVDAAKNEQRDLTTEEKTEFENLQREIEQCEEELKRAQSNPTNAPPTQQEKNEQIAQRAAADERTRISEITSMCRSFNIEPEQYIAGENTVEEVRQIILDGLMKTHEPVNSKGTADVTVTADAEDKYRRAAADALVMRGGVNIEKPAEGSGEFVGMSLRDLAIDTMGRDGANTSKLLRQTPDQVLDTLQRQYMNPTAAFPSILDQAINKAYVEGHRTAPVTFDKWTKKGTLKDFKTHDNNYLAGPAGEFLEVPEGAELKADLPKDEKRPTRKLKTYGRQFSMTRQAFINDDIDFLSKIPAKYAASARKTINKQCCQILVNNPAVYDGTTLFSTAHGNVLAEGTGITREALQKMFLGLQMQKDEFGEAIIIRPAIIVCPVGYSFDFYAIFNSATIQTSDNTQAANPLYAYRNSIEVIEDPTLNVLAGSNAAPWFVLGAKEDTDFIEVDYLNGQEIPTIRRMEAAGQLGFVWDIYLDWGITVMDYRGAVENPGTTITNPLA